MSRPHAYELIEQEVTFERETRLSALELGHHIMIGLGYHPHRSRRAVRLFREHDKNVMNQLYQVYKHNHKDYIESSRKNEAIIAEILNADMAGDAQNDYGWSAILSDEDVEKVVTDSEH